MGKLNFHQISIYIGLSVILLLISYLCIISSESSIQQGEQSTAFFKKHINGKEEDSTFSSSSPPAQRHNKFYTTFNKECQKWCEEVNGVNCGKNIKNCCVKEQCIDKKVLGMSYGEYCEGYIAIIGCTDPY